MYVTKNSTAVYLLLKSSKSYDLARFEPTIVCSGGGYDDKCLIVHGMDLFIVDFETMPWKVFVRTF
jgi:hypothetical protein